MSRFADELESEGWCVARSVSAAPSAPTMMVAALPIVGTKYAMRLDADTVVDAHILGVVAALERDGAAIASIKCEVANERATWATRFQALEYRMAMLSRHFRPWLTSGACYIGTTEALIAVFGRHSLWMPGEDIETGRVATALKMRVRHVEGVAVRTDAPDSWRRLFRQRRLWWAGNFRHVVVNFDKNAIQMPVWTGYYVALVWVGLYFKWWTFATVLLHPRHGLEMMGMLFGVYAGVTFIGNWQVRQPLMVVFPVYALVQAILMPIVGSVFYAKLAVEKRDPGRYRFGLVRRPLRPVAAVGSGSDAR